jgi:hypothetical protein
MMLIIRFEPKSSEPLPKPNPGHRVGAGGGGWGEGFWDPFPCSVSGRRAPRWSPAAVG